MKWKKSLPLGGILLLGVVLWWFWVREDFSDPRVPRPDAMNKTLVSKIQARAPMDYSLDNYIRVLQDYYDNVFTPSPNAPTPQQVDAFLNGQQQSLSAKDKEALRAILLQVFYIDANIPVEQKEAAQIAFQPSSALLQPAMAAGAELEVPRGYTTADVNPVLKETQKPLPQIGTLGRGGEGAAYATSPAAYAEDVTGQYTTPSTGTSPLIPIQGASFESTMAETTVPGNEIYGPRVPKKGGRPPKLTTGNPGDPNQKYPWLFGPGDGGGNSKSAPGLPNSFVQVTGAEQDFGGMPTSLPGQSKGKPVMTAPNQVRFEPVPFLADFSKFFK